MTVTIIIDPNVRIEEGRTYSGFEDVLGTFVSDLREGDAVTVLEEESGLHGEAVIYAIDPDKELVFLTVDWGSLRAGAYTELFSYEPIVRTSSPPRYSVTPRVQPTFAVEPTSVGLHRRPLGDEPQEGTFTFTSGELLAANG